MRNQELGVVTRSSLFLGVVVRGLDTGATTFLGVLADDPGLCVTPGDNNFPPVMPPIIPEADPARLAAAVVGLEPWNEDEGL